MSDPASQTGQPPVAKTCSRCGSGFDCGSASGACWCLDLPPAMPWPPVADCLCPDCLRAAIDDRIAARPEAQ